MSWELGAVSRPGSGLGGRGAHVIRSWLWSGWAHVIRSWVLFFTGPSSQLCLQKISQKLHPIFHWIPSILARRMTRSRGPFHRLPSTLFWDSWKDFCATFPACLGHCCFFSWETMAVQSSAAGWRAQIYYLWQDYALNCCLVILRWVTICRVYRAWPRVLTKHNLAITTARERRKNKHFTWLFHTNSFTQLKSHVFSSPCILRL